MKVSGIYIYIKQKAKEKKNHNAGVIFFGTAGHLGWRLGVTVLGEVFTFSVSVLGVMQGAVVPDVVNMVVHELLHG